MRGTTEPAPDESRGTKRLIWLAAGILLLAGVVQIAMAVSRGGFFGWLQGGYFALMAILFPRLWAGSVPGVKPWFVRVFAALALVLLATSVIQLVTGVETR